MKRQAISICISFFFITVLFLPIISSSNELIITNDHLEIDRNTGGWVKEINGVTILHVEGSYYEMGYQQGSLLKEECLQLFRAVIHSAEKKGITYEKMVDNWNFSKKYIPLDHIDELQGLADALDLPLEYIGAAYISGHYNVPLEGRHSLLIECCNFVAWGPATANRKLYHGGSYDVPLWLQDPESGVFVVQENQIVVIREPDEGYASMSVNIAGYLGMLNGVNEKGVVLGITGVKSNDVTRFGTPTTDLIKFVLDRTSKAEEAIEYIIENKTVGKNYVISDYKIPVSYVVETSASNSYIGTWNNPVESLYPFWEIDHVIRRVNLFHNQTLASTQRKNYNQNSFFSWIIGKNRFFPMWRHYRALSIGIENNWGKLDSNSMMNILRNTYNGRIDLLFFIATKLRILETWHQWVICPETGDMWFTLASDGKSAFKNEVHHVNLYDFLD